VVAAGAGAAVCSFDDDEDAAGDGEAEDALEDEDASDAAGFAAGDWTGTVDAELTLEIAMDFPLMDAQGIRSGP
jgi:hypothetical protein